MTAPRHYVLQTRRTPQGSAQYLAHELRKANDRLARYQINAHEHKDAVETIYTEAARRGVLRDMLRLKDSINALLRDE